MLKTVIIDECVAHMECRLIQEIEAGDKNLFIGEVIDAYADEAAMQKKGKIEFGIDDFPRKIYGTRFRV